MPLVQTRGAASAQGFGEFAQQTAANYIEDVFSTYLYTGNGSTQTITNGIDLSTKGGMVWQKSRSDALSHVISDTVRGTGVFLETNDTGGQSSNADSITAFNTNGFSFGSLAKSNTNAATYCSWTFRKQAKFFDVVTYTGNGTTQNISHSLGSTPGCVIVKNISAAGAWQTWHRGLTAGNRIVLNTTAAQTSSAIANVFGNNTSYVAPTSTQFTVGDEGAVNQSGQTMVAYLFAHDAGGFGTAGTDNVISCGSYTGNGSATGPVVTLGYEPQWLMIKRATTSGEGWVIIDNMRGMDVNTSGTGDKTLFANTSDAEGATNRLSPTATGFEITDNSGEVNTNGATYIYMAIRRGPMKTPTTGTSVFGLNARTGTGANATVTGSAGVSDAVLVKNRGSAVASLFSSRLTGTGYLVTSTTAAEVAAGTTILQANPWDVMDGVKVGTTSTITNASANTYINYLFDRAPSFFDEVCYTGDGNVGRIITHNLGVAPELIIVKQRTDTYQATGWPIYCAALGNTKVLLLNTDAASSTSDAWANTTPSATTFTIDNLQTTNTSPPATYVAYLFATLAGVSKVGSYTGTAAAQTINCGFTGGARFVLIKRTDSTGDWYVWDTARGIISGDDPYWLTNSDAAEVTNTDYIDPASSGFEISSTAPAAINASGGTFIFLAVS